MKQGLRTAGREAAMTARVHTADAVSGERASPGSAGDRGIVVEVSPL